MIEETLKKLDFSDKEVAVYLAILKGGRVTPANVAKLTQINRSTVYSVTKELAQKGLIAEDLGSETLYLVAKPAADLDKLVKREEKALEERQGLVKKAIKELKDIGDKSQYSIPKIIFVPEEDLEGHLYKQSPIWDKSMAQHDGTWWGFQDRDFVRHYEGWIDWYWEQCALKGASLKLLSNESAEEFKKKQYPRRKIKFWEGSDDFTASTWICGDYVVSIVTSERPHYLVEIHDALLANNHRLLFQKIWKMVK